MRIIITNKEKKRIVEFLQEQQKGCCKICGRKGVDYDLKRKFLRVDHCHTTGYIRGLLCHSCNVLLGFLEKAFERGITISKIEQYLDNANNGIIKIQKDRLKFIEEKYQLKTNRKRKIQERKIERKKLKIIKQKFCTYLRNNKDEIKPNDEF